MDEEFDRVARYLVAPAVDTLFQLRARKDGARPQHERLQQCKLARGQAYRLGIAHARFVRGGIERQHAIGEHGARCPTLAAQDGAHAGEQFNHLEGLEDVVIGAAVETAYALIHRIARGQDQHRDRIVAGAQAAEHCMAVLSGQAEIEQQQVVVLVRGHIQRGLTVTHPVHRVGGVLQRGFHGRANHRVVFN